MFLDQAIWMEEHKSEDDFEKTVKEKVENEEDDAAEGSRRSLPSKQIKISI